MCKKSVAQVSQWGLFVWTMCENMEKTVKKVSEPFFSNELLFFLHKMVPGMKISNLFAPPKIAWILNVWSKTGYWGENSICLCCSLTLTHPWPLVIAKIYDIYLFLVALFVAFLVTKCTYLWYLDNFFAIVIQNLGSVYTLFWTTFEQYLGIFCVIFGQYLENFDAIFG